MEISFTMLWERVFFSELCYWDTQVSVVLFISAWQLCDEWPFSASLWCWHHCPHWVHLLLWLHLEPEWTVLRVFYTGICHHLHAELCHGRVRRGRGRRGSHEGCSLYQPDDLCFLVHRTVGTTKWTVANHSKVWWAYFMKFCTIHANLCIVETNFTVCRDKMSTLSRQGYPRSKVCTGFCQVTMISDVT